MEIISEVTDLVLKSYVTGRRIIVIRLTFCCNEIFLFTWKFITDSLTLCNTPSICLYFTIGISFVSMRSAQCRIKRPITANDHVKFYAIRIFSQYIGFTVLSCHRLGHAC